MLRDEELKDDISPVRQDNYSVYGARNVWLALNREGIPVARCTVERLMRKPRLVGVRRGEATRPTTISNPPQPARRTESSASSPRAGRTRRG